MAKERVCPAGSSSSSRRRGTCPPELARAPWGETQPGSAGWFPQTSREWVAEAPPCGFWGTLNTVASVPYEFPGCWAACCGRPELSSPLNSLRSGFHVQVRTLRYGEVKSLVRGPLVSICPGEFGVSGHPGPPDGAEPESGAPLSTLGVLSVPSQ